jgi:hypothetical protein
MKILNSENLLLVLCALFFLILPQEARSSQEKHNLLNLPASRHSLFSQNDNSEIVLAKTPVQYKLNRLLKKHKKIYFKKNMEQDLFYYFSPNIKIGHHLSDKELNRFNEFLNELLRHNFN